MVKRCNRSLSRWFSEKWVDVCTGKPCGRKKGSKRRMPYCRPTRRINSKTPKTRRQLSKKKIKEMCRKKRKHRISRKKFKDTHKRVSGECVPNNVVHKKKYASIKKKIRKRTKRKGQRWGAYTSANLVRSYKKAGGKYTGRKKSFMKKKKRKTKKKRKN